MGGKVSLKFKKGDLVEFDASADNGVWPRGLVVVEEEDKQGFIEVLHLGTGVVWCCGVHAAIRHLTPS